jgi:hypothetical protein
MNCEEANNLLSARIDGEISPSDSIALDEHLVQCADCRSVADALATQDAMLTRAFAPRREAAIQIAHRTMNRLHTPRRSFPQWLTIGVAAAAGFLLALLIFRPWARPEPKIVKQTPNSSPTSQPQVIAAPPTVAELTLATGKVEILPAHADQWRAMETAGAVPVDARVRTGPTVRCEFSLRDGSTVRLNENSELHFADTRRLELADGQVWSGVAKSDAPFTVSTSAATVTALGTRFDVSRREGKEKLVVFEGSTQVRGSSGEAVVHSGEGLDIEDGKLGQPRRLYNLSLAERWIDEILVLKGQDNPELAQRIDDLLARLGEDKLQYLYESEIRGLGDHCVLPLTRYIQSDRSSSEPRRRRQAANIIADCAQPWCIPYLIELLSDRDGDVRAAADRGLRRLTNFSVASDQEWHNASPNDREQMVRRWQEWWDENKDTVPGGQKGPAQKQGEPIKKA